MLDQLDELDEAALDNLPFGVVCLDHAMTVVRMNRTLAERSGIQRWRAIGRDYFRDVAPSPVNQRLAQHVAVFASGQAPVAEVAHSFPAPRVRGRSADEAAVTTVKLVRGHGRVYLCIDPA